MTQHRRRVVQFRHETWKVTTKLNHEKLSHFHEMNLNYKCKLYETYNRDTLLWQFSYNFSKSAHIHTIIFDDINLLVKSYNGSEIFIIIITLHALCSFFECHIRLKREKCIRNTQEEK